MSYNVVNGGGEVKRCWTKQASKDINAIKALVRAQDSPEIKKLCKGSKTCI